ncbi:type II toxin-antitoxin system CcdA family antitoxin [Sphingomonas sp. IC-11]|uniref:type II toxin-antitoxin system CcdA family antitoxin n=1 Tax=Sphingomonas sp. IC-11 TaxID=2898528 RepID=UPI001E507380|nr:type II toxin-antitoxin system CcdA family antitoxin [Sphingomonas sp. IC-11]MCD2316295.1 type II toxin-antitoxin system CcdA family antitoxin [Sphingomonas sp. IC-11]
MRHDPIASGKRAPVNMSIDTGIVAAARKAGVILSQVSEEASRRAAEKARNAARKEENKAWIDAHRAWVESNELPLERYRMF